MLLGAIQTFLFLLEFAGKSVQFLFLFLKFFLN